MLEKRKDQQRSDQELQVKMKRTEDPILELEGYLKEGTSSQTKKEWRERLLWMIAAGLAGRARGDQEGLLNRLIEKGVSANAANEEGETALMMAAAGGREAMVKALLAAGADPNRRNHKERGALTMAMSAPGGVAVRIMEALLAAGADPNGVNERGRAELRMAVELMDWNSETKAMSLLERHGAKVSAQDHAGWSALHAAADLGLEEAVEWLLEHGAEVNARAESGWTPLTMAASTGNARVIKALLAAGADPSVKGKGDISQWEIIQEIGPMGAEGKECLEMVRAEWERRMLSQQSQAGAAMPRGARL